MPTRPRLLVLGLAATLLPAGAGADAVIVSRAMFASTIAEIFVDEERIRVELEIGLGQLEAFRNLLPDDLYEKLGHPPAPRAERLERFFRHDLVVTADGEALAGRILEMGPRPRVERDEVSGEPLPLSPDQEPDLVVFARLEYDLPGKPAIVSFSSPRDPMPASVGFVAYHGGIPVNDFRYLGPLQTLELDWEDPWYTAFRNRNLRRQHFAPMSGFLYVEPYEVRKEIVARPRDLQHWVDLGLEGRETIPVEMQAELKRRVGEFLREHHVVTIDGRRIEPELARVNFLERTLRTSRVIDPPVELDVYSAILGVIFVYPLDEPLPDHVTMNWDLWNGRIRRIPASAVDQAGPLPTYLEPDFPVLEWQNFLRFPVLPTLQVLEPPPNALERAALVLRWLLLAGCAALAWWARSGPRRRGAWVALALLATGGCFWLSRDAQLSDARSRELVSGLLHNVYRAFDFRQEEQIYDVLARSVEGDLLTRIYLETRRGLELANQGGARAKVKEIELVDLAAEPGDGGGFLARARWNVAGSVGHWGHVHQRRNQYRAELRVAPVDGVWKLTDLEILLEERL